MLRITNSTNNYSIFNNYQLPEEYNIIERDIWDFGNSIIISNKRNGFKSFESIDRFTLKDNDRNLELYIDIFTDLDGAIAYGDCQRDIREVYQYIINEHIIVEKDDKGCETLIVNIKDPWNIKENDIIGILEGMNDYTNIIGIEEKHVRSAPTRMMNKKKQDHKMIKPSIALVLDSKTMRKGGGRHDLRKTNTQRKND